MSDRPQPFTTPSDKLKPSQWQQFWRGQIFWLPYAIIILALWLDVGWHRLIEERGWSALTQTNEGIIRLICAGVTIALSVGYVFLIRRGESRRQALFSLFAAGMFCGLFLISAELMLPETQPVDKFHHNLQAQLERRSSSRPESFCGLTWNNQANFLGFIDQERNPQSAFPRIVFIGDSFLESRAPIPLAHRVEDLLRQSGRNVDVINLSKFDSDPETDYRHKFYELALDYHPQRIFMFIYAGNDLSTHFHYVPYQHPRFRVSVAAIDYLAHAGIGDDILVGLRELVHRRRIFASKADFLDALTGSGVPGLDWQRQHLIYLAALGYSNPIGGSLTECLFPKTVDRFYSVQDAISQRLKTIRKSRHHKPVVKAPPAWEQLREKYGHIFNLPETERLAAIARFAAVEYCHCPEHESRLMALLDQLPEHFRHEICTLPDGLEAVIPPLVEALNGLPRRKPINAHNVAVAAREYHQLFTELHNEASRRGVDLTLVFIPPAYNLDDQYATAWQPLTGRAKKDGRGPALLAAIKHLINGHIQFLDLTAYPAQFQGGYWLFDGHWNEAGTAAAARIITNSILNQQ